MSKNNPLIKPTIDAEAEKVVDTEELGHFAQLEREAMEGYVPAEPYVLKEFDPPIVITEPVESGRIVAIAELYASGGRLTPQRFLPVLKAICGDAFERVWTELLCNKHMNVAHRFMKDVQDHFSPKPAAGSNGAADVPGGSTVS